MMYPSFAWLCIVALAWTCEMPFLVFTSTIIVRALWMRWSHTAARQVVRSVTPSSQFLQERPHDTGRIRITHHRDWLLVKLTTIRPTLPNINANSPDIAS